MSVRVQNGLFRAVCIINLAPLCITLAKRAVGSISRLLVPLGGEGYTHCNGGLQTDGGEVSIKRYQKVLKVVGRGGHRLRFTLMKGEEGSSPDGELNPQLLDP